MRFYSLFDLCVFPNCYLNCDEICFSVLVLLLFDYYQYDDFGDNSVSHALHCQMLCKMPQMLSVSLLQWDFEASPDSFNPISFMM